MQASLPDKDEEEVRRVSQILLHLAETGSKLAQRKTGLKAKVPICKLEDIFFIYSSVTLPKVMHSAPQTWQAAAAQSRAELKASCGLLSVRQK